MNKTIPAILRIAAVAAGVAMAWSCCLDADFDYDHITPPEVKVSSPSVCGYITDKAGNPIVGAVVTLGNASVQTDATGYYVIEDVRSGNYAIQVRADGKIPHQGEVEVPFNTNFLLVKYNAVLVSESNRAVIPVVAGGTGLGTVTSESLKFNTPASLVIDAEVPAGSVNKNVSFYLIPIYDESEVENPVSKVVTKAEQDERLLIGATLSCSDPNVVLNKPVAISLHCDVELTEHVTAKYYNGVDWEDIPFTALNGDIIIEAPTLGSYALFLPFVINEKPAVRELTLSQSVWDNLYGSGPIYVEGVDFTYMEGTEIISRAKDVLSALLIEKLAYHYGSVYNQLEGSCFLDVTLPVGTRLTVKGTQDHVVVTVSYSTWSVNGNFYGDVTIIPKVTNRQHNGGSN